MLGPWERCVNLTELNLAGNQIARWVWGSHRVCNLETWHGRDGGSIKAQPQWRRGGTVGTGKERKLNRTAAESRAPYRRRAKEGAGQGVLTWGLTNI